MMKQGFHEKLGVYMKILEEKSTYSGVINCHQCECKLEYGDADVVRDTTLVYGDPYNYRYIICPKCNAHISIN